MKFPMHIPDGFLAPGMWAGLDISAALSVGYLSRRAQAGLEEGQAPLLGVMGAFVFAAQMINFPVGIGTSGHLVGSALLACTLGPAAAAVVMTAILIVQALVFQDGGVLALGANVMNMAVAGTLAGYLPYHYWGRGPWRRAAIFLGGVLSVLAPACLALAELRASGVPMPGPVVGVSLLLFLVSALVEGLITLAVVGSLEKMNAGWVRTSTGVNSRVRGALGATAILLASVGALAASILPDGLEKLAGNLGIEGRARTLLATPLRDYELRMISEPWLRKIAAGLAGLAIIYVVCLGICRLMTRKQSV
ncbi:MAG: energy-coupling factor ABC transporter permease [Acidobacteriia bacterium]|nr:energy-coupling factor ABC transporter permease [Terriglobia bacterium]